MTIVIFKVFTGKMCSAVSLLPQDFYANFGVDPFTDDAPHDSFMLSVIFRLERPYGKFCAANALCFVRSVHDRTNQQAPVCKCTTCKAFFNPLTHGIGQNCPSKV